MKNEITKALVRTTTALLDLQQQFHEVVSGQMNQIAALQKHVEDLAGQLETTKATLADEQRLRRDLLAEIDAGGTKPLDPEEQALLEALMTAPFTPEEDALLDQVLSAPWETEARN